MDEFEIAVRQSQSVSYAIGLLKQHREELGFIPTAAFEKYNDQGCLNLALLNGQPCGYLLHSQPRPTKDTVIFQACIQYDTRRRLYGALLVESLVRESREVGALGLSCKCAFDIEANSFWDSIGWYCTGQIRGGVKRARLLNMWRLDIATPLLKVVANPVSGEKSQRIYELQRRTGKLLLPFGATNGYGVKQP